ncbi:MAG: hypothetical protein R8M38_01510 [Mariprofundaceae bacterium]
MMKFFTFILVAILTLPSAFASSIEKKSLNEATLHSDFIFEGRVIEIENVIHDSGRPFTHVTFEILDIVKGQYNQSAITLKYLGGTKGDYTLEVTDMHQPALNEHGIYFVESLIKQQVHPLYGWSQGHYLITKNRVTGTRGVQAVAQDRHVKQRDGHHTGNKIFPTPESFKQQLKGMLSGNQ